MIEEEDNAEGDRGLEFLSILHRPKLRHKLSAYHAADVSVAGTPRRSRRHGWYRLVQDEGRGC